MRRGTGRVAGDEQPAKWWDRFRSRRASRRATGDGARREDRGFTLVEVVMTIVLISITIIPIISATFTSVKASTTAREVAEIETVLLNAADRVNRAPTLCDYTMYVQAASLARGWAAGRATATNQYYVPGSDATVQGTWASGACPNGVRTPRLIQMVTIYVKSESGNISRSIQVVKSDI
jgi:prepilin-type N-terminal cleavage/methylation domain-containing protein